MRTDSAVLLLYYFLIKKRGLNRLTELKTNVQTHIKFKIMENNFELEDAVSKLYNKLDGWLDAIILKLPNIIMAIVVMILFYILARIIRNLLKKLLAKTDSQKSVQDIIG